MFSLALSRVAGHVDKIVIRTPHRFGIFKSANVTFETIAGDTTRITICPVFTSAADFTA
jgi:hypothetical protein